MTDKEKMVALYMKKLDLTREEAEQMYQDEMEDNLPDLSPEQAKVAKAMAQADRKKETAPRKRERKPDDAKRHLMALLEIAVGHNPDVEDFMFTNPEREATFKYKGEMYRITLAKPRK